MEINPNRNLDPAAPAAGPVKAKGPGAAGSAHIESDDTSFESSSSLTSALDQTPDARAELIARAEKLVSEPGYPPPEMIRKIANLLAANLIAGD